MNELKSSLDHRLIQIVAVIIILVLGTGNSFAAYPQCRNTNGAAPTITTAYLGDTKVLSHDSWAICNGNWPRWRVFIHTGADINNGIPSDWTGYSNVENKSATTPKFTSTGTWYWGFEVDYEIGRAHV